MARIKFIVQNSKTILMLDGSLSPEVRLTYFLLTDAWKYLRKSEVAKKQH